MSRRALLVVGALATIYVVWGSTYLGIALAIETMPPLAMAGVRFLLAGIVLFVLAGGLRLRPDRRQWAFAALTGAFLLGVGNGGVSWAQQTVPSGIASLVIASIPLWIALIDRLFFGARLGPAALVGIALGFVGVAVLLDPGAAGDVDPVGGIVLLLAAIGWSAGTLLSRGQSLTVPPLLGAGMQMLCGGTLLLVVAAATGELGEVRLSELSARSTGALAYLILFGSLVAFSAYVWLLRNTRTSIVATYAYVNPVVAVFLGWLVLGEAVTARTLVAGGVIVAAVALIVSARPAVARERRPRVARERPRPQSARAGG